LFILPAYVANGAPVIFGGGKPLDLGKSFRGKRIFGDHKTIRGLISGLLSGFIISLLESFIFPFMLVIGTAMSFGTHAGDLFGSFVKRRIGMKEGESFAVLDQYLFFIFALLFALPFGMSHFPDIWGLVFITVLTGILHLLTNRAAFKLNLKKVPW